MKLAEYIAKFLHQEGIKHVYVVSGGAIIHSIDAVARHPDMDYICVAHEQAAGAAADAYSRVCNRVGTAMVTSGPGATNLTTSISNAYFDSIPCLFICGQVTTPRLRPHEQLRQKGFQETDVVSLFSSITKYVTRIMDPTMIRYELQKALYLAKQGRPGPVVLDIPDDLQRQDIDIAQLKEFFPPQQEYFVDADAQAKLLVDMIEKSKRPILILGAGVRLANAIAPVLHFARLKGIPILLTWGGKDILSHDDPLNMGGLGVVGPRWGNFAVQNADLVIGAGTRLSQMITGGKTTLFAPKAKKVLIDIDPFELKKFTSNDFRLDMGIQAALPYFFKMLASLSGQRTDYFEAWRAQIKEWEKQFPICPPVKYKRDKDVDGHVFVNIVSAQAKADDVFIGDTGANLSWTLQAIRIKEGQRIFSAWNHTPMGYALSASIGAVCAGAPRVLCLTGDGGLMMNIQELATIKRYGMNVKVFIFNNNGHAIQKQTIDTWLNGNYAAVDPDSGLSFPDFVKVAEAFGLPALRIDHHRELEASVKRVLETPGPFVCDVIIDPDQKIEPMLKFGSGLEDLNPKLPMEQLTQIMKVSRTLER